MINIEEVQHYIGEPNSVVKLWLVISIYVVLDLAIHRGCS
jgi:hypothetical protein